MRPAFKGHVDGLIPARVGARYNLAYGAHNFVATSSTGTAGNSGTGVFTGFLTSAGNTYTYALDQTFGQQGYWQTTTTSGNAAGFYTSGVVTRRDRSYQFNAIFVLGTSTSCRMFIGNSNHATLPSGTDPLNVLHGLGLTINGGNFRIAANDGVSTTVFTDFSPSIAVDTAVHKLRIVADHTSATYFCDLDDGNNTVTISSNLPGATTGLRAQMVVETATTASRDITVTLFEGLW